MATAVLYRLFWMVPTALRFSRRIGRYTRPETNAPSCSRATRKLCSALKSIASSASLTVPGCSLGLVTKARAIFCPAFSLRGSTSFSAAVIAAFASIRGAPASSIVSNNVSPGFKASFTLTASRRSTKSDSAASKP
ncbi:MAG TPA: hypothetical protein EYO23_06120 [Alphaproteobacteria bacterium]|nr:hypothetical protein [Alphaproteobacteria bacterium]